MHRFKSRVHFCFREELVVLVLEEVAIKTISDIIGSGSDEWAAVLVGRSFNQVGSCGEGLDEIIFMGCNIKVFLGWK